MKLLQLRTKTSEEHHEDKCAEIFIKNKKFPLVFPWKFQVPTHRPPLWIAFCIDFATALTAASDLIHPSHHVVRHCRRRKYSAFRVALPCRRTSTVPRWRAAKIYSFIQMVLFSNGVDKFIVVFILIKITILCRTNKCLD
ncbi:hypothetical protein AAZX31_06G054300 [Glycine max]|uniref:Uncharacterized protein n=2 Tax=Glycine subgen. Soja TaxID=1462606 RepID=K7KTC0_SOYBN|nr:hypothetical protein JHK87_014396 [Glycine soja]KAG5030880.1 hypothetical protein JHK85_014862 [Glycine max]KAG5045106.1 hypothetical protein JHK86_014512 [Glycine max]KAG5147603.1 hypothetical protein JHK82_014484 [Glycine max]KAH1124379.1 hypothetical protein GYH30_014210 [Glycine max]